MFPKLFGILVLALGSFLALRPFGTARADTPNPTSVTIAGSLQSELGCSGDWQPDCANTQLTFDGNDDVWQASFNLPAGSYEYKAALNNTWDENYGLHAQLNGTNIPLSLGADASLKFYYDHKTHWATDNKSSIIVTVPGSFQSELGCASDWDPGCLRSWLQDPSGSGTYSLTTSALPAGNYEAKAAINESWDENYGANGILNGPNLAFTVPVNNSPVTFTYDPATHILTIKTMVHGLDNNVEWDGLRHDSRDLLYRTPGGAVPAGTPVTLRFRTFHNDVNKVSLRVYDLNANAQHLEAMTRTASDVSCYQSGLENQSCDYWAVTLPNSAADNLWYRFIVTDGTKTVFYADNTPALDGGLGAPSDSVVDNSFALMIYERSFSAPAWTKNAVIYQIFPDRFRNGRKNNDPKTGDIRYADPVLALPWNTLPEGFCHNYADGSCPWRFGTPPVGSPDKEASRGRDYMGGDLNGVDQSLEYLKALGVNTIYFNPIFDAGSNHSYDTQDYLKIDPYFGTEKDWESLVRHADRLDMRIVLDGVFNHMSSDSALFDRYHHYKTVGACESLTSQYRSWFTFHEVPAGTGTCVGSAGANSASYDGWFGFDSIPVLNKSNPAVQAYFLTGKNSVARTWLDDGASGWRLDVMGDASFPNGYWESFRKVVKKTDSRAVIIGELWQKDSTLLRFLRGDRADTTMNYRLRDAVVGLLAPGNFDSKGFADSGRPLNPSEFAARLSSIREDYPDAAFFSLMNLVDSHDTERLLWTLTPGLDTRAEKEQNAANLAAGKLRQRLASLIQFSLPGAPTIYYGDEVGQTGDDDPDDRRTYPWPNLGGQPDRDLYSHYQSLANLRKQNPVLTAGDLRMLLANDADETVAYGRKTNRQAALVLINRSAQARTVLIPLAGYIPDGVTFNSLYAVGMSGSISAQVSNGTLSLNLEPLSAWLLATDKNIDLQPPAVPTKLHVTLEGNNQVGLAWKPVPQASGYNLYRSPVHGGGWVKLNPNPLAAPSFNDSGLRNGDNYFYTVTALDAAGNESAFSQDVMAQPHLAIGWANLQGPASLTDTISTTNRTENVYGQVFIDGVTNQPGTTLSLVAQLGFGPVGSNPAGNTNWTWVGASFNTDVGNNDEFLASLLPEAVGAYDYIYRYTTTNGRDWLYADLNGPIAAGVLPPNPGKLQVVSSGDMIAPAVPAGLQVVSASPGGIGLAWQAVTGDSTLYGYEVLRSASSGGPYSQIARVTSAEYTDTNVAENAVYYYVVRALDNSFNRSANSAEVSAAAALRTVTLVINLTVPATTDTTGRSVYIAGLLDRLDGNLPQWDPGGVVLTRQDATHWVITLTGKETVQIEYKYTLGDWDHVEKDNACGEVANRPLTLNYGTNGTMTVNDTVLNWRNVAPCGN
jgi:glycosidase